MLENFRQQALQVGLSACLLFFPAMLLPDSTFSLYLSVCLPVYLFMLVCCQSGNHWKANEMTNPGDWCLLVYAIPNNCLDHACSLLL